jgi:hypothetical protein
MNINEVEVKSSKSNSYNPFSIPLGSKSFDLVLTNQTRKIEIKNQMRREGVKAVPPRLQRVPRRELVGPKININQKPENPRFSWIFFLYSLLFSYFLLKRNTRSDARFYYQEKGGVYYWKVGERKRIRNSKNA